MTRLELTEASLAKAQRLDGLKILSKKWHAWDTNECPCETCSVVRSHAKQLDVEITKLEQFE